MLIIITLGLYRYYKGGVPKAITDLVEARKYKSRGLGPDIVLDGSIGSAVEQPICCRE